MLDRVLSALAVVPFLMGAAAQPVAPQHVVFRFTDPDIVEASGLVVQDGLFLTTNDSGDTGRIFAVDPSSGDTVGVTHWSEDPDDVEAVAPAGDGMVWVGDIGDNAEGRDSISVTRVPVGRGERTVSEPSYELVYPDRPHNAETLMVDPTDGRLYVVSKELLGGTVYSAPSVLDPDEPNLLTPIADAPAIATDGAILPDGRHAVIRDYGRATFYSLPAWTPIARIDLPAQPQGEGIAVAPSGVLYVSSEGENSPVLRVPVPASVSAELAPVSASASPSDPPPRVQSRAGSELPESTDTTRSPWPWFLGGWLGVAAILLLMRSLRRR